MSTTNRTKINQLLLSTPKGIVLLSSWLKNQGYSLDLIKRYRKSGWLESIGVGAYIRAGDNVDCYGAIYSLQTQGRLAIHIGGRSAFAILGKSHYLDFNAKKVILFVSRKTKLPSWFTKYNWRIEIEYYSSNFLPPEIGLADVQTKEFKVKIASEARAIMECLHLVPHTQEVTECYELMESLNNLHPQKVQELLQHCTSIKVKRLFLYLAERIGHEWFKYLDLSRINLGSGKRSIVQNGVFDKKYQITIPKEWSNHV